MQIMKNPVLSVLFLSCFIAGCAGIQKDNKPTVETRDRSKISTTDYVDEGVSMIQLLANPEKYRNLIICVQGFLNLEFEGNALYMHKEDYEECLLEYSIWVHVPDAARYQDCNKKYVRIVGTFDPDDNGHMGMFKALPFV
jgi:hypothetical protein